MILNNEKQCYSMMCREFIYDHLMDVKNCISGPESITTRAFRSNNRIRRWLYNDVGRNLLRGSYRVCCSKKVYEHTLIHYRHLWNTRSLCIFAWTDFTTNAGQCMSCRCSEVDIRTMKCPVRNPDLNAIEHIWDKLKWWIRWSQGVVLETLEVWEEGPLETWQQIIHPEL